MIPYKIITLIAELDKAAKAEDQKKLEELKPEFDRLSDSEVGKIFDKLFTDRNKIYSIELKEIKENKELFQLIYKYCIQPDSTKKRIQIALNKAVAHKIFDSVEFLLSNAANANVNATVEGVYPIQLLDTDYVPSYMRTRDRITNDYNKTPQEITRDKILYLLVFHGAYVDLDPRSELIAYNPRVLPDFSPYIELFEIAANLSHPRLSGSDFTPNTAVQINGRRKSDGRTALHVSVLHNNTKLSKALLKFKGVKIHIEDHNHITPLQMMKDKPCDNSKQACVLGLFICKSLSLLENGLAALPKDKLHRYNKTDLEKFELCGEYIRRFIAFYEKEILNLKDKKLHQDIHTCADKISDHLTMLESPHYNPELGKVLLDSMAKITSPEETAQYNKINQMLFKYHLDVSLNVSLDVSIKKEEEIPDPTTLSLESKEETESKTAADINLEGLLRTLFNTTPAFQAQQPVLPMISQYALGDALYTTQKELEGVTGCNPESMMLILKSLKHYKEKYEAEKEKREALEKALQSPKVLQSSKVGP